MKVYYPGPGWRTFHPVLGELRKDEPFKLDEKIAKKYIKSGLLKEAKPEKKVSTKQ